MILIKQKCVLLGVGRIKDEEVDPKEKENKGIVHYTL